MNIMRNHKVRTIIFVSIIVTVLCGSHFIAFGKDRGSQAYKKQYTSIQIESGDSLWSIARTHMGADYDKTQDYIDEVIRINRLNKDTIHVGQYLTIPYGIN